MATIEIPDDPSNIPEALKNIRTQLAKINMQRAALYAAIKAIQNTCNHPRMTHYSDYDGGSAGRCPVCDYSF